MIKGGKVIITCAVTGSVHTPSMSEYLPITPDEITEQAVAAADAGAAILHLHARNPRDGRPTPDPEVFMQFLPRIRQQCDAVVNITTGGSIGMSMDERLAAARRAEPELTSMNMGTMNFGVFLGAEKITQWKHDWEKSFLEASRRTPMSNTFEQIEMAATELSGRFGTRFEFECYDVSHLYTLAHFADRGVVKPPFLVQCVLGVLGGIGAEPENLVHMVGVADKLFGQDWHLSVLGAGRHQMPLAVVSAALGGHVRVGLEDSLMLGRGRLAKSNAEQVTKIRNILEEMGREIATPDEARAMLQLKGGDNVAF
ncbi:MAG TPA: 3-keto-5-aminohexanoate cleavage protein [Phenylobacterium sp.]|uniref:3-keto-5-aminohexanoate cleavage protein n=1 Tax=Phenylobacterium sp. TaxID=1871053 RepID=UPI002B490F25|nr:3-keto-5-aminohexanoate cleavage protein [Phenylobacterium sp.]HKR25570.1 3-keto-5-aminohexanoate cleavage protein [Allosphingosinicella sp.]HKR89441.1 3-keto-5-aminohexanoate cleavage protein [Phenylobacterium sp.]